MEIKGQLKLTRLSARDTDALNLFFAIRHYQHPNLDKMAAVTGYQPDLQDNCLIPGEFGPDGEYLIPSISRYRAWSAYVGEDCNVRPPEAMIHEYFCEEMRNTVEINKWSWMYSQPPGDCPLLWLNFRVWSPEGKQYSYLTWNGYEKTFRTTQAVQYINILLKKMGYEMLEGKLATDNETGFILVTHVHDGLIEEYTRFEEDFSEKKDVTWFCGAANFCDQGKYVGLIKSEFIRAETFAGSEQALQERKALWVKTQTIRGYLGCMFAPDRENAKARFAKSHNMDPDAIELIEV